MVRAWMYGHALVTVVMRNCSLMTRQKEQTLEMLCLATVTNDTDIDENSNSKVPGWELLHDQR